MVAIGLLLVASAAVLVRPRGLAVWVGPAVGALAAIALTPLSAGAAWDTLTALRDPLLFLAVAVPLAVALDGLGVFAALAATVDGGRHLTASLWVLAAAVVVVFNLDAAVVLLTPLYARIARRHGFPVEAFVFQPALLACFASGVLPVSNLTNLIAAERVDLSVTDFLSHLALPSLAATFVGFWAYRATFHLGVRLDRVDEPVDGRALRRGVPIIVFVLAGFTLGDALGVPAWVVGAVALGWALVLGGSRQAWRAIPVAAIVVAAGLAVIVAAAAGEVPLDRLFGRGGGTGDLGIVAFGVLGSNLTNNLPVVLAGAHAATAADEMWPLLVGANVGAVFVVTASLSTMLWRDTAARVGVEVSARRWSSVAVRVGAPALLAAVVTSVVV